MNPFKLVIFDCDGVLVNSEPITACVVADLLTEMGLKVSAPELHADFYGRSLAQCLALIVDRLGKPIPVDFVSRLRKRTAAALWAEVAPIPGVAEALVQIQTPVCVASSGELAKIRLTLGKTGLLTRFGANIFSAADVATPKPAPDLYLYAALQNGVDPHHCAVIEDSPIGVRAGVAAGMTVFGFAAHTSAQQLQAAGAHVIFADMAQLAELLTVPVMTGSR